MHESPSVAHNKCIYVMQAGLCTWDNSGTEGNSCKANSSTEGNSCYTNNTIFERASEIFPCKPNKYGSFCKIVQVEFVLVEFVQAEDPLYV